MIKLKEFVTDPNKQVPSAENPFEKKPAPKPVQQPVQNPVKQVKSPEPVVQNKVQLVQVI